MQLFWLRVLQMASVSYSSIFCQEQESLDDGITVYVSNLLQ